ncbi:hypothetical protein E6H24_06895 [Candidatus Bathyarchaeota archaeon]|nr:MAG: hypothetical protein E6H24_06895 [Candidatus Bathyarchaeota archaeon]
MESWGYLCSRSTLFHSLLSPFSPSWSSLYSSGGRSTVCQRPHERRADYQPPGKPRWLTVAPKGQDHEFILVQGNFKIESHLPPEAGTGGIHWALNTDDCQGDYERLKARGVNFKVGTYTKPQKQTWGTSAYFKDPDGNQFALIQPKAKETGV